MSIEEFYSTIHRLAMGVEMLFFLLLFVCIVLYLILRIVSFLEYKARRFVSNNKLFKDYLISQSPNHEWDEADENYFWQISQEYNSYRKAGKRTHRFIDG